MLLGFCGVEEASNSADQIMKTSRVQNLTDRLQWTSWTGFDDFDIADVLALLPHTHQQMQEKNSAVGAASKQNLNIYKAKNKILRDNSSNAELAPLEGMELEEVEAFIDKQGGTDAGRLKNVGNSQELSLHTIDRLFNTTA